MNDSSYQVARLGSTVFVRSVGLANMKNAPMLDAFLREVLGQGVLLVCVDLSCCSGMDSTFMGLLVGFSQDLEQVNGQLVVVNPTEQNLARLLDIKRDLSDLAGAEAAIDGFGAQSGRSATPV